MRRALKILLISGAFMVLVAGLGIYALVSKFNRDVVGIKQMISGGDAQTEWNIVMATAMLAMLPPALVVVLMQKWFVKGLVDTEK